MPAIHSGRVRAALLLGIFLLMLLGNVLTPYAVDDWAYMHSFATGERLTRFGEIFPSMAAHAQTMNGRLFAHFWAQLFLLLPKAVFNIVNALIFTALIALLARLTQPEGERDNLILLMIFCAVWVFVPAFGQVFFWLDGACNYGWGCVIGFAFLAPYIRLLDRDAKKKPLFWILWMLAGFYTGAYLENMAAAAIFLSALLLFGRRVLCRKKNGVLPWLPVLASVGGFIFMMTRPAEGMKSGAESSLASLGTGLVAALEKYRSLAVLLGVFAVSLVAALWYHARRERIYLAAALVLGSLCANFALSVASYYPERCLAFPAVLLDCGRRRAFVGALLRQSEAPGAVYGGGARAVDALLGRFRLCRYYECESSGPIKRNGRYRGGRARREQCDGAVYRDADALFRTVRSQIP